MKRLNKVCITVSITLLAIIMMITSSVFVAFADNNYSDSPILTQSSTSKKFKIILKDEYGLGVIAANNQKIQYRYELKTYDKYDNIKVSIADESLITITDGKFANYEFDLSDREYIVEFSSCVNDGLFENNNNIDSIIERKLAIVANAYDNGVIVQTVSKNISLLITPHGFFTSPYDSNSVKKIYYEALFERGIISRVECDQKTENLYIAEDKSFERTISQQNIVSPNNTVDNEVPSSVGIDYTVELSNTGLIFRGTVVWSDVNAIYHPARKIYVEICRKTDSGDEVASSTETDDNGYFYISGINKTEEVFIKVFCSSAEWRFAVSDFLHSTYYFSTSPRVYTENRVGSASKWNSDIARGFQVHQAMILGSYHAADMGLYDTPSVGCPGSGTYYNSVLNKIWIDDGDYCDFDVILHEYGHFIMDVYNFEDQDGLDHAYNGILTDSCDDKEKGIKLAWGEGWSTYFGISAQLQQNAAELHIPNVGDTVYTDTIDANFSYDALHNNGNMGKGEGNELAVTRVLLNLAYSDEGSPILSIQEVWNICKNSKPKTLSAFISIVYGMIQKSEITKLGNILESQNITPTTKTSSKELTYDDLEFNWSINKNYVSKKFSDSYKIVFYDKNYNKIGYEINTMLNSGNDSSNYSYQATDSEKTQLKKVLPRKFYWGIKVNQKDTPSTGSYISSLSYVELPIYNQTSDFMMSSSTRYAEREIFLSYGNYFDYNVTFSSGGSKLIQTFGLTDTVIEFYSQNGTLLKSGSETDDKGYSRNAFLRYYVSANTTYKIRVKLYSSSSYGKTKLTITPAYSFRDSDKADSIEAFDDISSIPYWSGGNRLHTYVPLNYCQVDSYTPNESGSFTFEVQAEYFDSYIYVIDPRNSNYVVSGIDYDDDSGEGSNAKLTKNLEAGVRYYIIYCQYDISKAFVNTDAGDDCYLVIHKN